MAWTVDELLERAQELIEEFGETGDSKRVRWEPNQRLVRYYTTLGLVDKPLGRRGQVVHYGPRHLLQLLAVKQMQARGMTLQQIQRQLLGSTDQLLEHEAGLPRQQWRDRLGLPVEDDAPVSQPTRFWERRAVNYDSVETPDTVNVKSLRAMELPGVTVLLHDSQLDADQVALALQPLLELLRRHAQTQKEK